MEKYKALIVEDVQDTSNYIKQRIEKLCPQITLTEQAFDIEQAYQMIVNGNYDIVFLDIQMPSGTSFDLLKTLNEKTFINFEIIFITGESDKEYPLRAIKYSALDFLYKPLDDKELIIAVNKAVDKLQRQNYNYQVKILLERIGNANLHRSNKIAFYLHNGIVELVDIQDIVYLRADGVISHIILSNGNTLITNRNLGYYKEMLIGDYDFKVLSNSLLVNSSYIKRYSHKDLTVTLTNGEYLYASKRFGQELKETLNSSKQVSRFSSFFNFSKKK